MEIQNTDMKRHWLSLSICIVHKDIIGMQGNSSGLCISDSVGRSHGDVNSDSLLVQPVRCRITKKHLEEWMTHPAFLSTHPSNLLSCTAAIQLAKSNLIWSNCIYEECQCACGLTSCHRNALQGQAEGKGGHKRSLWIIESDYLVTYGWWLSGTAWQIVPSKNYTFSFLCCLFICLSPPDHPFSTYTYPSTFYVLVVVSSQSNFWGGLSSNVL